MQKICIWMMMITRARRKSSSDDGIVTADEWLSLVAKEGTFAALRFGLTPRDEARVWETREMREHTIYFCMQNGFFVVFRDKTIRVDRGDFIWIMPNVINETRLLAPRKTFRTYYLRFSLTRHGEARPIRLNQDWIHRSDAWHLLPHVRNLVLDLQSPRAFHDQRTRAALVMLTASALEPEPPTQYFVLNAQQRLAVQACVETRISDRITPQMLAKEAGLSMPYFSRIFHSSYGMSPKQWIMHQRIKLAALILAQTQISAKEVSYRVGYRDQFLFSRQFKQVMGVTTRQFRRGFGAKAVLSHSVEDLRSSPTLDEALARDRQLRRRARK